MTNTTNPAVPGDDSVWLDALRERLFEGWRDRRRVSIETLLAEVPSGQQARAFAALLEEELACGRSAGEPVTPDEYYPRFPQYRDVIDRFFAGGGESQDALSSEEAWQRTKEVSALLDRFEQAWQGTRLPRLEDFVPSDPAERAEAGPFLVELDWEYRERNGLLPRLSDYRAWPRDWLAKVRSRTSLKRAGKSPGEESIPVTGDHLGYLGDYELLEPLGRGGMGVVYKARQLSLNRIVALKWIRTERQSSAQVIERFQHEAEAAAKLTHPGIVPIYEIGQAAGQPYYSMAYVDGPNLGERLQEGPLAGPAAAALLEKVAEAVEYAHRHGVIHRDLKPGNVLLDPLGEPKVTDFGLARNQDEESGLTQTGEVLGTPSYMSPEQAAGRTEGVGPLADVYALGALLYCLLTGRPPFQAATVNETLQQVREQEPVSVRLLNAGVPRDLETICHKCLQKEPTKRYGSAGELAADLGRFRRGEPITARPVSAMERGWRWVQRNRALAGTAAIAALAIGIGSVVSVGFGWIASREAEVAKEAEQKAKVAQKQAEASAAEAKASELTAMERSADLAVRKGDWGTAIDVINRAWLLTTDPDQRVKLGIEKAKGEWVLSRKHECRETLKSLREQVSEGPLRRRVLLWSGVIDSGLASPQAVKWLEEAGAEGAIESLQPGEQQLIQALLAPTTADVVRHLRTLLDSEPFFPAAQQLLIAAHIVRGEPELAHREIEIAQRLKPGDPNTATFEALLLALEATPAEIENKLPALLQQMSEASRSAMQQVVPLIAGEVHRLRKPESYPPLVFHAPKVLWQLLQIANDAEQDGLDELLVGPAVFMGQRWFHTLTPASLATRLVRPEALFSELIQYDLMGDLHVIRGHFRGSRGALAEAEADYLAAEGRLLFPIQTMHTVELMTVQFSQATQNGPPDLATNEHAQRAVASLRRLRAALEKYGPPWGQDLQDWIALCIPLCMGLKLTALGEEFIDLWDAHHPATVRTLRLRGDLLRKGPVPDLFRALDCYQRALKHESRTEAERTELETKIRETREEIRQRAAAVEAEPAAAPPQ